MTSKHLKQRLNENLSSTLSLQQFMKKHGLKNETMTESDLRRIYDYKIYPRDSKITTDRGFVNIDNGEQGGTHWTCFIVKDNKSFYFDSFGGSPDKFLLEQLPKPITYHNFKIQDIDSKLCGSYCLYFFYLMERMNYFDAVLTIYFSSSVNANRCFRKQFFIK